MDVVRVIRTETSRHEAKVHPSVLGVYRNRKSALDAIRRERKAQAEFDTMFPLEAETWTYEYEIEEGTMSYSWSGNLSAVL